MRRSTWLVMLVIAALIVFGAVAMHQPDSGLGHWMRTLHGSRP